MSQEEPHDALTALFDEARDQFSSNQRILSFAQFIDALSAHPRRHARSAVQYLRDCVASYGVSVAAHPAGERQRCGLFDAPFDQGRDRMLGQEVAQERVFQLLDSFARSGRSDKLILLHGPNGSAKSTFVQLLMRGLEHYSSTEEGALYAFNWVFPSEKLSAKGSIGFSERAISKAELKTFADLDEEQIDAKIVDPLHDHPLLLLPQAHRQRLLERLFDAASVTGAGDEESQGKKAQDDFALSEHLLRGDLSHTNRVIFDALLTAYRGDLESVLKHVQIERFFISRRYRRGAVSVEPQMRVDAAARQISMDRRLQSLPPVLQSVSLFETSGDLVDANRGIIEYDDLFNRHPDLNKYLLSATERAAVSLDHLILHLDAVLIATGNEIYLDAFKQTADYASFKGRVELVRVPYLLDYTVEQRIYEEQLAKLNVGKFVAPLTSHVVALWAVLTRLKRPNTEALHAALRETLLHLKPIEKADLYALGRAPEGLSAELARELRANIPKLLEEAAQHTAYEGRFGASPREMKMIMLNAAQRAKYPCLSPLAIFEELELLVKDTTVFPFLQMQTDGDYARHEQFIQTVRLRYLDLLDEQLQDAVGLIDDQQYDELFARYIDHVSQSIKGEKVYSKVTKRYEEPDEAFMVELEEQLGLAGPQDRPGLISSIAAAYIDDPSERVEYKKVFPNLFAILKRSFYEERFKQMRKLQQHALITFEGDLDQLTKQEIEAVTLMLNNLRTRHHHSDDSAREALAFLLSSRYNKADE